MIKRRAVFAIWLVLSAGLSPALTADTADEWAAVASQRLKDGERDAAIEALQAAVAADPTNGAAGLLITTLYQAGRIEEAYALGERYHREGPRNPR
ncbi:MAG: tetratricopeptide repeat protein, partial [Gammaproteobacteria bacterium]